MSPQRQEQARKTYSAYPTSPWTEAYHASPSFGTQPAESTAMPQANEREAQQPTQDALSDIYNRGY